MKPILFTSAALLTVSTVWAQNSVTINQSTLVPGRAGNSASVSQSGEGNRVRISQRGGTAADGSKSGNRVSLRVPKGTQAEINQQI